MPTPVDYVSIRDGAWRLTVLSAVWTGELQVAILTLVRDQCRSKHPQTIQFDWQAAEGVKRLYLKVFHKQTLLRSLKDMARNSNAIRFWWQGLELESHGFGVPQTIAAGELRRWRFVERAFVLTEGIDGQPLPIFLTSLVKAPDRRKTLALKWAGVKRLAEVIRRFHDLGFVHGDMLASNLLVGLRDTDQPTLYFMDNDRTRRYPAWFCQWLSRRNLVQLNRIPLPGITLQDRIRFLQAYLGRDQWNGADRRLARWLEVKTRKRRHECDGVDPTINFRELMRWSPGSAYAQNANRSCS
jgi:hypothetical protein